MYPVTKLDKIERTSSKCIEGNDIKVKIQICVNVQLTDEDEEKVYMLVIEEMSLRYHSRIQLLEHTPEQKLTMLATK